MEPDEHSRLARALAAASLAKVTENLEKGDGALPILLRDDKFGKEFTRNLLQFSERINSISRKLDDGTGTAGKLINDPAIFDAANHLVVGVDQSAILRWLIKDRQKSGIKKEYKEYKDEVARLSATPATPAVPATDGAPQTPTPFPR